MGNTENQGITHGVTQGGVRWLLRAEALALLLASLWAYQRYGGGWTDFALLFFLPDVALLTYVIQPRAAAICYNITHSSVGALGLLVAGLVLQKPTLASWALVWLAHIGFDRTLGYGLKYGRGFAFTHLGVVGSKHADGDA